MTCPRCHRSVRDTMRFCPGCGLNLQEGQGPGHRASAGSEGALRFPIPQQQMYPMPYYPMPYYPMPGMYPVPPSGRRSQAIAAGVLLIIAACFMFIGGLYYLMDAWWWTDFWAALAALCFVTFAYALFGALGLFQRRFRVHSLLSSILLAVTGFLTLIDLWALSMAVLALGITCIILVALSWRQAEELRMMQAMYAPMMGQMPTGMPPPGPPPTGGPPTGAPPPAMADIMQGSDTGAAPPPPVPFGDEEVVAHVDE